MEAAFYNDLDASWAHAWEQLVAGVNDRHHGFHTIQTATVDSDGLPQVRTVILRAASPSETTLRFHTDTRAGKIGDLQAQPIVAVHAYHAPGKLQLRLRGRAQVHVNDDVAAQAWAESRPMSRTCYRMDPGPGTALTGPDAYRPGDAVEVTAQNPDVGYAQFCVVVLHIDSVEWLYLAAAGHRRARWTRHNGRWTGQWLAP